MIYLWCSIIIGFPSIIATFVLFRKINFSVIEKANRSVETGDVFIAIIIGICCGAIWPITLVFLLIYLIAAGIAYLMNLPNNL